jgi:hypothetical protein
LQFVPSLEPRNLDSIRYIVSAVSNHEKFSFEELKVFVMESNYEFNDSYNILHKCEIIETEDDYVILNLSEIEFVDVYREVLFESCKYNRILRKSALQIGINRSGNFTRRENVDQLLRNSDLYDSSSNQVTYWWFQLKELDRENSTSVYRGNPHTGFYGERLTIDYEKKRLNSRSQIEWVSLLPNGDRFGYDIKSVRQQNGEKLLIEVKSSKSDFLDAKVFLTRNEYKIMLRNLQNYVLYLWWNVEENTGQGPLLVEGSLLAEKLSSLEKNDIDFSDSLIIPFTVLGSGPE